MAEENGENQQPKSKSGKGLMIALIAVVIILILAVAGGGYYLFSKGAFSDAKETNSEEVAKEENAQKSSFKANIDDLVLNITNLFGRYNPSIVYLNESSIGTPELSLSSNDYSPSTVILNANFKF